ncbi:MAG: SpoIIE family protein phosphatase [Prevotella sp.]|nr:SpoIIE family protein phosphatase [Prevotella sp.]
MKLPRIFKRKSSIAKRLAWRIILSMTVVFTGILAFILIIIWAFGTVLLVGINFAAMQVSTEKINNVFVTVETAVTNNVPEVKENLGNDKRLYFAQENLLTLNPNIIGSAVAYNPAYGPKKGQPFSPYAYRDSMGIHTKQLTDEKYDYQHQEWYEEPMEQGKGTWSEPYVDKGGGEIPMITYSLPLINNEGDIYAIHTADISLDWLSDLMREMDNNYNEEFFLNDSDNPAYSFIISHEGTFIVHPKQSYVLSKNIQDFFKEKGSAPVVMSGSHNTTTRLFIDNNNKYNVLFYSSIQRTDWTMGVMVPLINIIKPVLYIVGILLVIMILGLIVVALMCRGVIKRITKPLRRFADSADEISKGNFQAELPKIKSKDEMLRLRNSFETMQTSLVRQIEETKIMNEEKGRLEGELHTARHIQMSMLPKTFPPFPERDDLDIYGLLAPAKEVGGDLYDFYIRDEKLFFCIGDVSGKGVPASLVMAVTRSLFRSTSSHENRPSRIINIINDAIARDNESNMFVTFFLGILDLPTGRLRYCNAGHNAPISIKQDKVGFLQVIPNIPIGVLTDFQFEEQETWLPHGAAIFLFTDGLNEAENNNHEQFGDGRILAVEQDAYNLSAQEQIDKMTQAVKMHVNGAEQNDDMTMLSIKYVYQHDEQAKSRHLILKNQVEELNKLPEFVDTVCEEAGIDMVLIASLNLALEEAATNVVLYAYGKNEGEVDIEAVYTEKYLKFILTDTGVAFDPTQKEEVDTTLSVEERQIGGLGIHLVRQIMDSVNYERINGKNVLTLIKRLNIQS